MRIRSRLSLVFVLATVVSGFGCNKPTEEDCQKAIDNINKIHGQTIDKKESAPAVRKCRSSSTKEAVACMLAATTKEQVQACEAKK